MNAEEIREYALQLKDVTEGFPFGDQTLVFRANEKIFLFLRLEAVPLEIATKGLPDDNIELRESFPGTVSGAYHLNKKHWNGIVMDGRVPAKRIKELIGISHDLVYKPSKKK